MKSTVSFALAIVLVAACSGCIWEHDRGGYERDRREYDEREHRGYDRDRHDDDRGREGIRHDDRRDYDDHR